MTESKPLRTAARRARTVATSIPPATSDHLGVRDEPADVDPGMAIAVYGCGPDEDVLFREAARRFGVVPRTTELALSQANIELAAGNRCISVDHRTKIENGTLLALARTGVRYICTRSVGLDHIDVDYAASVGIVVANVAYSPDSVADFTLMLMLMVLRHAKSTVLRAEAHDYRLHDERGRELRELTVGVVGTGRIGTAVISRLRAFDCRIVAYDHRPTAAADHVSLDELLRQSDIVTLHAPLTADTHHLIDRARIGQVKRGASIVNTGRGALLETEALVAALEDGHLGGAALDVVEGEEGIFYSDRRMRTIASTTLSRLQKLPNVIITPHTAYYTDRALRDMVEHTIVNCLEFERGQRG